MKKIHISLSCILILLACAQPKPERKQDLLPPWPEPYVVGQERPPKFTCVLVEAYTMDIDMWEISGATCHDADTSFCHVSKDSVIEIALRWVARQRTVFYEEEGKGDDICVFDYLISPK